MRGDQRLRAREGLFDRAVAGEPGNRLRLVPVRLRRLGEADERARLFVHLDEEAERRESRQPIGVDQDADEPLVAVHLQVISPRGDLADHGLVAEPGAHHPRTEAREALGRERRGSGEKYREKCGQAHGGEDGARGAHRGHCGLSTVATRSRRGFRVRPRTTAAYRRSRSRRRTASGRRASKVAVAAWPWLIVRLQLARSVAVARPAGERPAYRGCGGEEHRRAIGEALGAVARAGDSRRTARHRTRADHRDGHGLRRLRRQPGEHDVVHVPAVANDRHVGAEPEPDPGLRHAIELRHRECHRLPTRLIAVVDRDLGPGCAVVRRHFDMAEVVGRFGVVALPERELDPLSAGEVERRRSERGVRVVDVVADAVGPRVGRTVRRRGGDRPGRRAGRPADVAALDVVVEDDRVGLQHEVLDPRSAGSPDDARGGHGWRGRAPTPRCRRSPPAPGSNRRRCPGRSRWRTADRDRRRERRRRAGFGHRAGDDRRRRRVDDGQEGRRDRAPVVQVVAAADIDEVAPGGEARGGRAVERRGRGFDGFVPGAVVGAHRHRRPARPGRRSEVELGGGDRLDRLGAVGARITGLIERGNDVDRVSRRDHTRNGRDGDRVRAGRGPVRRASDLGRVAQGREIAGQDGALEEAAALEELRAELEGVGGDAEVAVAEVVGGAVGRIEADRLLRVVAVEVGELAARAW